MEVSLIYPHQLFTPDTHPALARGRTVYLVEEPLLLTYNPAHRARLLLHRLTMRAYQQELTAAGYEVKYIELPATTESVFETLHQAGVTILHIADTTDTYLERAIITASNTHQFSCQRYDSPLFILSKEEAKARYTTSTRRMANFYKQLRIDHGVLLGPDGTPTGGQWSFDADNRQKLPKDAAPPPDLLIYSNADVTAAKAWLEQIDSEQYGEAVVWLPYTRTGAIAYLQEFLTERFAQFGPYEDAMTTKHTRLWHSTLSPLINIGLLTPLQVLDAALTYAATHDVPINSLEGFVRQILGWREFIRASYEVEGNTMRTRNFFGHTRPLPRGSWDGTSNMLPLDHTITTALRYGYTHHIERLMVAGNFFLLTQTNPDEVYRWFMAMYIDAYDWVMVPNVYGMSQFADGGSFATKPYISGANYLRKMSDYPKGDWEHTWTALYWHFIATHHKVFESNHRLSMMPRLLKKMDKEKRNGYRRTALDYFGQA